MKMVSAAQPSQCYLHHNRNKKGGWGCVGITNRRRQGIGGVYLLVDLDADGALGDVPDASGAAVVELVRHALVDGAVHLDVDVVGDLVGAKVRRERDVPLLAERPREGVARARARPQPAGIFLLLVLLPAAGRRRERAVLGFERSEATLTYRWILGHGLLGNSIILDWLIDRDATDWTELLPYWAASNWAVSSN
jgi:hypothetical protein